MPKTRPHGNVIEFDTSKVQLLSALRPSTQDAGPAPSIDDLQRKLAIDLQTSLEPDRLLSLFLASARLALPVSGFGYRHEPTGLQLEQGDAGVHSVSYRLHHEGESLGELIVHLTRPLENDEPLGFEALLPCLLFPLRNALLYRAALLDALRDPLTGAGNRVAMNQTLAREIELARRHGQPLSLLMLDIDHFKQVNDRFGHHCGDEVLKAVTGQIRAQLRNVDRVFRYGGEEFLVLLSSASAEAAEVVGRRLCQAVETMEFLTDEGPLALSVSVGCASYRLSESVEELLKRADEALYQAKRNGRNQLRMAI